MLNVDFIGIGMPKCGTTWLFYALGQHPQICLAEPKEVNYFNHHDFLKIYVPGKDMRLPLNANHTKPFSWYQRHYRHCPADAVKGEFSPSYIYDKVAPERIRRLFPQVKLLASLRNPIDKVHSTYWARKHYSKREKVQSFAEAIRENPTYLDHGLYAKHLKRYFRVFDRRQIKVILLEDIKDRPEDVLRDVFRFLNVDPEVELRLDLVPRNEAKKSAVVPVEPLLRWSARILMQTGESRLLRKVRDSGLKQMVMRMGTKPYPRQPIEATTREQLSQLFRDDISELEQLLERDLSVWR